MALNWTFIDPLSIPDWNNAVSDFPDADLFHTTAWARTLMEAYRYLPCYAVGYEDGRLAVMAPMMEVRSALTGTRGVSLPFTDYCKILDRGQEPVPELFERLKAFGRSRGWRSLETRGMNHGDVGSECSRPYLVHELDLTPGTEAVRAGVRDSTARNIAKADKSGVTVIEDNSGKGMREFCRLNALTRRDHGLPPQPGPFFHSLLKHIIGPGMGKILLAVHEGRCIASAVFLYFNRKAIFKYGASDRRFLHLRANNLVMWHGIRRLAEEGCRSVHLGRTHTRNAGLLQYKRGWGASEKIVEYRKYDIIGNGWVRMPEREMGIHTRIFSRMPIGALNLIGRLSYRHLG